MVKRCNAASLKQYLLEQEEILIRDASNFRGLDESYIRLSTQRTEQTERLVAAMKRWLDRQ